MGKSVQDPKNHIISCRINHKEMEVLQAIARETNTSISTLLRKSLTILEENLDQFKHAI